MSPHRDLLAEVELTMVPSLRMIPAPEMYVPGEDEPRRTSRRSFWCSLKNQVAEVEFETKSILGFPRLVGIRRCSAFDEPMDVTCGRQCLDSDYRRRWPFSLPVVDRQTPPEG